VCFQEFDQLVEVAKEEAGLEELLFDSNISTYLHALIGGRCDVDSLWRLEALAPALPSSRARRVLPLEFCIGTGLCLAILML